MPEDILPGGEGDHSGVVRADRPGREPRKTTALAVAIAPQISRSGRIA